MDIISNGQVLKFYNDPDAAELEGSHSRHHYVEAVAGSTFKVKVNLRPEFKIHKMKAEHGVRFKAEFDGTLSNSVTLSKRNLSRRSASYTFEGQEHLSNTGQSMLSEYSFGSLVLSMLGLWIALNP